MMSASIELRIPDGRMHFGDVPEHVDAKLQAAVVARGANDIETCEGLLWEAHQMAPQALPVYYALYKFYFNRRRLEEAERAALIGLDAAARQLGISADWTGLTPDSTDWTAGGAARFFLFTLKALAFINLRRENPDRAEELLGKLRVLDPEDQVGYSVIALLAKGGAED